LPPHDRLHRQQYPAHGQQGNLVRFPADAAVLHHKDLPALLTGRLEPFDVVGGMKALHPGQRGAIGSKPHQQIQQVAGLQGAMYSLQTIGAFRMPGARVMQQVARVIHIAGTAHRSLLNLRECPSDGLFEGNPPNWPL